MATRVLVENPGHHLGVRGDVGCRYVAIGTEHDGDALREAAGEPLELELGEPLGVYRDAALGAAERNVHERGLPRHDRRQAEHLVMVCIGVVADPSLARASRAVVLDAVAGKDLDAPVVHADRHLHLHLAKWSHEDMPHVLVEVDQVGCALELAVDDRLPRHDARGSSGGGHGWLRGAAEAAARHCRPSGTVHARLRAAPSRAFTRERDAGSPTARPGAGPRTVRGRRSPCAPAARRNRRAPR